jgi:hypothetical protein
LIGWRKGEDPTGGTHLSVRGERGRAGGMLGRETAGPRGEESRPEEERGWAVGLNWERR